MLTEYVSARFPEGQVARTSKRGAMLRRTRRFVTEHADRPKRRSRIREAGEDFGVWKSPNECYGQVERRTAAMGCGPKLIIQREHDQEQFSIREVLPELVVPDLGANPLIELLSAELVAEFGMGLLRDGGLYVCRRIDGTLNISRHGFVGKDWKGAARDWFVKSGGMTQLKEVARFQISRIKHHNIVGAHLIVEREIYTHPSGTGPYGGQPHFHTHQDVPEGWACNP